MTGLGTKFKFDTIYQGDKRGEAKRYGAIKLYQIGEMSCVNGYEVPAHRQWCHELSFVISGEGKFTTNNSTELLLEGDVHFAPLGSSHEIKTVYTSNLRFAYIGFDFVDEPLDPTMEQLRDFYTNTDAYKVTASSDLLIPIFRNLDELYNQDILYPKMVETYLIQILIVVYRTFTQHEERTHYSSFSNLSLQRAVYAVIKYIDKHIYEKIEVGLVAEGLGYNVSYLSTIFRKNTGLTLQRYISNKKLQKAIELMKYSGLTPNEVAKRLSFANVQTFNKAFKRTFGYPPTKFMEMEESDQKLLETEHL